MSKQVPQHRGGRRRKDEALVLRDQYWVRRLQTHLRGESWSSIERRLWPNVKVGRREEGQGYRQPFAPSKIANGSRGLSDTLGDIPPFVKKSASAWMESEAVYSSCLWTALHEKSWVYRAIGGGWQISGHVSRRLTDHHYCGGGKVPRFTPAGVRRLGRLTHIDALGLLLLIGGRFDGGGFESALARLYVPAVFGRLCLVDLAFASLAGAFEELIGCRYLGIPNLRDKQASSAFNARDRRAWDSLPF